MNQIGLLPWGVNNTPTTEAAPEERKEKETREKTRRGDNATRNGVAVSFPQFFLIKIFLSPANGRSPDLRDAKFRRKKGGKTRGLPAA